ncbi:Formate/nitrite transporter [Gonapodya prolifera JEL478]|uniref:Formate/nitrite transporter n=1 Tax=Gonapodya prolifera (strain JEL478) TaxID=1344416 RepID=A0A139A6Z4_GONPJ|nr:Formate/nitrite transporter [Gonapodya prolifera JEL478]|eukprot:KXS12596.1 Formate/nitrite transporter [Gonapodya prolifera JEL478]
MNTSSFLSPPEATKYLLLSSLAKCARTPGTIFVASLMGGAYLSLGGLLSLTVAGGSAAALPAGIVSLLAGITFPVGLSMIIFSGTDLLTGNMLYGTVPFCDLQDRSGTETQHAVSNLVKILGVSFVGNLIGSAAMALSVGAFCGVAENATLAGWVMTLAKKKCALPFATAFVRGIGANWLVCLAVYMSMCSRTAGGKILSLWIPISTFVALGFEHSVANMFTIPLGMYLLAATPHALGMLDLFGNLLPVILGNFVGASIFVAAAQWYLSFGSRRGILEGMNKH